MRNRASMGSGAVCHCEELCGPAERRSNSSGPRRHGGAGSPRPALLGLAMIGKLYQHPCIVMRGIYCVLIGGMILGATSRYGFARGWGDSTEGRPLLQVFKANDYQASAKVNVVTQDHDGVLYLVVTLCCSMMARHGAVSLQETIWQYTVSPLMIRGESGWGIRRSRLFRKGCL